MEYYSAIENKILPFAATWMHVQGTMLSEISQTGKRLTPWMHMWNLKKKKSDSSIQRINVCLGKEVGNEGKTGEGD